MTFVTVNDCKLRTPIGPSTTRTSASLSESEASHIHHSESFHSSQLSTTLRMLPWSSLLSYSWLRCTDIMGEVETCYRILGHEGSSVGSSSCKGLCRYWKTKEVRQHHHGGQASVRVSCQSFHRKLTMVVGKTPSSCDGLHQHFFHFEAVPEAVWRRLRVPRTVIAGCCAPRATAESGKCEELKSRRWGNSMVIKGFPVIVRYWSFFLGKIHEEVYIYTYNPLYIIFQYIYI